MKWALSWYPEIGVAAAVVTMATLLGVRGDWQSLLLLVIISSYLGWQLWQVWRLSTRLTFPKKGIEPAGFGIWTGIPEKIEDIHRRDKKRKKKMGKMLTNYQKSVSALPDATVVIDDKHGVEWWNDKAVKILGITSKSFQGKQIEELLSDPAFHSFLRAADFSQPLKIPAPANDGIMLEVRVIPFGNDKLLLQARDITRLARLETVRRDFVANVSHEIRTPLTVIHGYLETLIDSGDTALLPWQKIVSQMQQQSTRMQRIVEDLLLLSRLESKNGVRHQETVDVAQLLPAIKEEAQCLSGDRQHVILLEADPGLMLEGIASELESAFSNLIFNAVRYTPAGGQVSIRWWRCEGGPCFSVTDTGIGIAAEHIPRLSERFYRVDVGRSRASGGTGLGLAIVKHALHRHGARLEIDSTPGVGSTFRCLFPESRISNTIVLKAS